MKVGDITYYKGDLIIQKVNNLENELEGEVFFAAPSYFPTKMRNTLKKWKKKNLRYVLFNSDAASEDDMQKLMENNSKISFISVKLSEQF